MVVSQTLHCIAFENSWTDCNLCNSVFFVHMVFYAQVHYQLNCLNDSQYMQLAASNCLLREIQISILPRVRPT
jgi:hypothetical protein